MKSSSPKECRKNAWYEPVTVLLQRFGTKQPTAGPYRQAATIEWLVREQNLGYAGPFSLPTGEPVPPILPLSHQGQGTMFGGLADIASIVFSLASTNNATTTPTIVPDNLTLTISLRRRAGVGNTGENAGDAEVPCGVSAVFGRVSVSGVCFSASSVGGFTYFN